MRGGRGGSSDGETETVGVGWEWGAWAGGGGMEGMGGIGGGGGNHIEM